MNKRFLNEILSIRFPLIQGGMMNIADVLFAAAVCEAGGLGQIACGMKTASAVRLEIRQLKALTNQPFGVNIMLLNPQIKEIAQVVAEEKVSVVTTGAGNPAMYIPFWKENNLTVIPVVASVAMAKRVEMAGADVVIVEGTEAGGHVGELTTLSLLPQVVDQIHIPVVAAGGIMDNRSVKACLMIGAIGVQVGTRLLATAECKISAGYKQALIDAKDTDTMVIGKHLGSPVRVLKTPKALALNKLSAITRFEFEQMLVLGMNIAITTGDFQEGIFMASQAVGLIKTIKPLATAIADLFGEGHE